MKHGTGHYIIIFNKFVLSIWRQEYPFFGYRWRIRKNNESTIGLILFGYWFEIIWG